jgi:hypothetical protein
MHLHYHTAGCQRIYIRFWPVQWSWSPSWTCASSAKRNGKTGTTDCEYFFVSQVTVVSKSKCKSFAKSFTKSFTNLVKDSETFTYLVKDLETFTNLVKDLETFTNLVKDSESFTKSGTEF